jgi:flagellar hook-length control protein FliK
MRSGSGDDFSLNELLLTPDLAVTPDMSTATPARSKSAGGGKTLPDDQDDKDTDKQKPDTSKSTADPLFSWITALLAPQPVRPSVAAAPASGVMTSNATSNPVPAPTASTEDATAQATPADTSRAPATSPTANLVALASLDASKASQPAETVANKAAATATDPVAVQSNGQQAIAPTEGAQGGAQAPAHPAGPNAQPAQTAQTASQVFAAAILAAQGRKSPNRESPDSDPQAAVTQMASAAPADAVKASELNHQSGLDLRQDTGLQSMVDHIETLRDNADATDTRIRLTPAGLGTVDVAVRKDGDTVHVHFAAEQPETRTLIADAQPRLSELAQARGIRLGETSVSGGASDPGRQQPQQAFTAERAAPARAQSIQSSAEVADGGGRIA